MRLLLPWLCVCACNAVVTDPSNSGVAITPSPGDHQSPDDVAVVNHTDGVLNCVVLEEDLCPSLAGDLEALSALEPGQRWQRKDVTCLLADFACRADGAADDVPPLRAWSWYIDDLGL